MPDESRTDPTCPRARPLILVIDDDPAVLDSLELLSSLHGCDVLTEPDGRRGLEAFRAHEPTVVVTDVLMPEQDGLGALLEMRRERPEAKIVVISGSGKVGETDYLAMAEKLGATAVVDKMELWRLGEILPALLSR
jgi:CheY-like chemotaxis protein